MSQPIGEKEKRPRWLLTWCIQCGSGAVLLQGHGPHVGDAGPELLCAARQCRYAMPGDFLEIWSGDGRANGPYNKVRFYRYQGDECWDWRIEHPSVDVVVRL